MCSKAPKPLTDRRLLDICQQAARRVCGGAYARHGDDAAGEAMLSALKAVQAGAGEPAVVWHAHNGAVNHFRKLGGRDSRTGKRGYKLIYDSLYVSAPDGTDYERPGLDAVEAGFGQVETAAWVDAALRLLTVREQQVFCCFLAEINDRDAGRQIGVCPSRVGQLRREAFRKIRRAMERGEL